MYIQIYMYTYMLINICNKHTYNPHIYVNMPINKLYVLHTNI